VVKRVRAFLLCDPLGFTFYLNHFQIHKDPFEALYNLVVDVNIMSVSFAHDLLRHMSLTPITKLLKNPSGYIVPSLRILYVLPI
jgi:hypothetical protein